MILEQQLAQQIVDRTMAIIGNNINVMNQAGVIIGSGDPHRIGQTHDGALLALKHGDTVEITQQSCQSLKGAKPGINMLMKSQHEVIGVVGITGDPDSIRNYASLVKMTAEMIVDQAALIEQLQWDRRHKEEFISAWITNSVPIAELKDWAARLDIDLDMPRVAVVIELHANSAPLSLSQTRQIVELLEYPKRDNLVAVTSMREIVVLKPSHNRHGKWDSQQESVRIDILLDRLHKQGIQELDIALGEYFPNVEDIHLSYQSARQVLQFGQKHHPEHNKYLFEEMRLPVLLSPLGHFWQGDQLCKSIVKLKEQDKSGQLLKTLYALFEHQGNQKLCAESLYIHRNTLRYRLDKIEKITRISPKNFTGLVELYIASQITK
ncbi:sugar diacid recognition domain-containing protein [Vibrio nigripulchritudo]|uniref:sugar diacid recognition domain-containing protein n=1 Tax=Vibrio nigripulchritudo TaxID=28173 RepID=UPI00248FC1F9|nr:sugar diacid recognition domain-containing protein [Vibrio nigripulchritudo]BDU38265.1 CdaR family transcriptional regulator [Vibrio nigripulchritudo]BDU43987.1 CdaR family transcriptional regulator [Vibrio nigripulchritudo]